MPYSKRSYVRSFKNHAKACVRDYDEYYAGQRDAQLDQDDAWHRRTTAATAHSGFDAAQLAAAVAASLQMSADVRAASTTSSSAPGRW
jgi:hypothetical protein